MRPVKRVLLASAAGIVAATGAQAADLAVKAKPVEYVKVCDLYGAGFWYIPGTDTCLKVGGFIRFEVNYNADGGGQQAGVSSSGGQFNGAATRATGQMSFRERSLTSFDARTQTEYGTLRSYFDIGQYTQENLGFAGGTATTNPPTAGAFSAITVYNTRAFVQFAGLTAGRIRSFFDMVFLNAYINAGNKYSGDSSAFGITGIAYTWQFGGGLSASLSFEDGGWGTGGHGRSTINLAGGGLPPANNDTASAFGIGTYIPDNKGQEFFDPVANIRMDQSWGFVGASFALHDASGGYYGQNMTTTPTTTPGQTCNNTPSQTGTLCGHPGDKFGWAGSIGGTWLNPFGIQGDTFAVQGVYAVGAAGYATQTGSGALFGAGNKAALTYAVDGVYDYGSSVQLTHIWSVDAVYEHLWNDKWKSSVYGGALGVDFAGGKNLICNGPTSNGGATPTGFVSGAAAGGQGAFYGTAASPAVSNCNPNSSSFMAGTRTMWTPYPDVDFSLDLNYTHVNSAFAGSANLNAFGTQFQPAALGRPSGTYTLGGLDVFAAYFAIRRGFLY
jgi:Porin subfamily